MGVEAHVAAFADLDGGTLYALLKLRVDVFVVEQKCAYPELDGRDTEPGTRHVWLETGGAPVAYLRVLDEPGGGARIGRVVVAAAQRGTGLASRLMAAAMKEVGDRDAVLDAQTEATLLYERFGFKATGPEFVEDGIPHIPMTRHRA
ncbi:GNAT family N-acetyltransferase [Micromonospora sp. CPCC 206061]|uniref:GNAT family N-acetyltransferase n=1 Tax=Micromonospora sp. CPCC 206061 TaxID=3122410 RepID=UPI002FEFD510